MQSLISGIIRQAIAVRLEDPVYGYNAAIQSLGAQINVILPQVDFSGTAQFFQANCDPALIDDGTAFTFPLMLLYSHQTDNRPVGEKFRVFKGSVTMMIEVLHSWDMETVDPAAFEDTADVVEAAIYQVFNPQIPPFTPPDVFWGGEIVQTRLPIQLGGDGLLLHQKFALTFRAFI